MNDDSGGSFGRLDIVTFGRGCFSRSGPAGSTMFEMALIMLFAPPRRPSKE